MTAPSISFSINAKGDDVMWFVEAIMAVFRLIGFASACERFLEKHEQKVKAQEVADAPSTRPELEQTLDEGKL